MQILRYLKTRFQVITCFSQFNSLSLRRYFGYPIQFQTVTLDFSYTTVFTDYPRYCGMGLFLCDILKSYVYFKTHDRFQFIRSFTATGISRNELSAMDFFNDLNNLLENNSSVIRHKGESSRKQSTPNFPKNEHFLPPDTQTYVCLSGGKKCSFFWKFGVLCFLETPVLRFALLPY